MKREPFFRRLASGFRGLDRITQIVLVAFLVAGLATAVIGFNFVYGFVGCSPTGVFPGLLLSSCGGETGLGGDRTLATDSETGAILPSGPALEDVYTYTAPDAWDGSSRVNILVMGLDARDWEAGTGAPRTDTMMVLTYDPVTQTAGMLSIPRDIWVEIPGFTHDKINNAYALGEGSRLPGGGAGLAVQTVEQFLGITINYYAQIDFIAFEQFIDYIGGVKIDVPNAIRVQLIGEKETVRISGGRQVLNGAYALAYARNRHEGDGDFDRARRQQQIILGVRQQLERDDVRAKLLNNILQVYEGLSGGINTNMSLGEALSLAWAVKGVNLDSIEQAVIAPGACTEPSCIGADYVIPAKSPEGLDILKPVSQNIRLLRDQVFASGSVRSPLAITSQSVDLMKMEAAQVAVYNGSGIAGLAESTSAYLQAQGMVISASGNEDAIGATVIYDYTGNPYTVKYLSDLMSVNPSRIFSRYDPNSAVDVMVIVGPEWVVPGQ